MRELASGMRQLAGTKRDRRAHAAPLAGLISGRAEYNPGWRCLRRFCQNAGCESPQKNSEGFARNTIKSPSRRPVAKVLLSRPNGVVVFRPKRPAVQIAWPSGPGKSPPNHRPGPTGRQFISSARRMAGPLGLKIFFCSWTWPSGPGYWNGWPFGPETQVSGHLKSSQKFNTINVC